MKSMKSRLLNGEKFNVVDSYGDTKTFCGKPEELVIKTFECGGETCYSVNAGLRNNNVSKITAKFIHYYDVDAFGDVHNFKLSLERIKFLK